MMEGLKILDIAMRSFVCLGGSLETKTPTSGLENANPGPQLEDQIFSSLKAFTISVSLESV